MATIADADLITLNTAVTNLNVDSEAAYQAARGQYARLAPLAAAAAEQRAAHLALTVRAEAAAALVTGTATSTPPTTSTIALLHLSEVASGTRPAVWVNSVPGGPTFNNWGDNRVPGCDSQPGAPFGQGAFAQSSVGACCAITSNTPIAFNGDFTIEGAFIANDDYRDVCQYSTDGSQGGTMRIRVECRRESPTTMSFVLYAKNGTQDFIAFQTAAVQPIIVGGQSGAYHFALQRASNVLALYMNGARVGLATTPLTGGLSGYVDAFGSFDRTYDGASGMFNARLSELRVSNAAIYSGANYTVPTARFTNPS